MLTNQIALSLFFLYFVLMSGPSSKLMNCELRRFLDSTPWVSHIMIIISIYIFTFILNWYNVDSLVVEKFQDKIKPTKKPTWKNNYLLTSLLYSFLIYGIFLLSTKTEGLNLFIFLIGMIAIVMVTIYNKSRDIEIFNELKQTYFLLPNKIRKLQEKYATKKKAVLIGSVIQNGINVTFVILLIIVLIGNIKYFERQYADHGHHWSWFKFILGSNTCKGV